MSECSDIIDVRELGNVYTLKSYLFINTCNNSDDGNDEIKELD